MCPICSSAALTEAQTKIRVLIEEGNKLRKQFRLYDSKQFADADAIAAKYVEVLERAETAERTAQEAIALLQKLVHVQGSMTIEDAYGFRDQIRAFLAAHPQEKT